MILLCVYLILSLWSYLYTGNKMDTMGRVSKTSDDAYAPDVGDDIVRKFT